MKTIELNNRTENRDTKLGNCGQSLCGQSLLEFFETQQSLVEEVDDLYDIKSCVDNLNQKGEELFTRIQTRIMYLESLEVNVEHFIDSLSDLDDHDNDKILNECESKQFERDNDIDSISEGIKEIDLVMDNCLSKISEYRSEYHRDCCGFDE